MTTENPILATHNDATQHTDVNKTLGGMSQAEATDWAAANDVELDVAEQPTDHAHMIGCVLSAARVDDDHIAVVVGTAVAEPDPEPFNEPELAPVLPVDNVDQAATDDLDDYFRDVESENEQLAEMPDAETDVDETTEVLDPLHSLEDQVTETLPTVDDAEPRRRVTKGTIAVAVVGFLAIVSLISSLSPHNAPTVNPPASVAAATPVKPAKQTTSRRASSARPHKHKAATRRSHHHKRRHAHARPSTPQAAPRPVVSNPQPAAPGSSGSGSCGSRSSEFSFEC